MVAYADVRQVMGSQLRQRLRQFEPMPEKGQEEFKQHTGIDIETDIDHVVAYMVPSTGSASGPNGLVLARGRFDEQKIEGLAKEHGGRIEDYRGKRIAVLQHDKESESKPDGMAVAFVEPGLVAVGTTLAIRRAIDIRNDDKQNVTSNSELMDRIKELDEGAVWAIGRFDAIASQAKLPSEVTSRLPAVSWFSASGNVNGGITGTLRAEARDEEAAKNLRDLVNGFLALAKLQAGSRPEAQAILPNLQLGGTGKSVTMSFTVPNELFDAFAGGKKKGDGPADRKKS
jgi:hypothetical protein